MKSFIILSILVLLFGCKENTVDNNPSLDLFNITNGTSVKITYEIIGASEEQANRLGYKLSGEVLANSNKEIYKSIHVAVAGYGFDSLKIRDTNNLVIYKVAIPYPFSEKCKIEKINNTTSRWTLTVDDNLLNSY